MPRRLGDDPLSRKKKSGDAVSAQSAAAAPQTSHNDVFFRRRSESASQRIPGPEKAADTQEGPENEVAELVKTAQAAMSTQGAGQLAEPMPAEGLTQPAAPEEEAEASPTVPEPSTAIEPSYPAAEDPPSPDQPQSEPEKSGFFKRLFGRLGK